MQSVEQLLSELTRDHFYGTLEIKFEAGKAVLLRKTETIKPIDEDYRNTRGKSDERNKS